MGDGSRHAIEARIQCAVGIVVLISEDADEGVEEKAVDESDVLVTRWRCGKSYFMVGTSGDHASLSSFGHLGSTCISSHWDPQLGWLFSAEFSGTLHSPFDSLIWYPTPTGGIPNLVGCVRDSSCITIFPLPS